MATSMITDTVSFDDMFRELMDDLDTEAKEWPYLDIFYLNFDEKIEKNEASCRRSNISQQQSQHPFPSVASTVKDNGDKSDNHRYFYDIPDYVSTSSANFLTKFSSELFHPHHPIDFQDLKELAILTHQTFIIHLHQQLWHCFLQVHTALLTQPIHQQQQALPEDHTNLFTIPSFWPKIVTSIIISKGIVAHCDDDDHHSDRQQDPTISKNFIQNYLHQLDEQVKQRRLNFNTILKRLSGHAHETITGKIEEFLQNEPSLSAMRLHFERRIALLKYICTDRIYQSAYFQQKPTDLQLQIVKQICSVTYEKEKAEHELSLYQLDLLYKNFPKRLYTLEKSPLNLITSLSDPVIRQQLSDQYQRIVERTKADLLFVYTCAVDMNKDYTQKKSNQTIAEMWKNQHQQSVHEQFTPTMLTIIEQRQKNIIECVRTIYHLKGDFYVEVPRRIPSIVH